MPTLHTYPDLALRRPAREIRPDEFSQAPEGGRTLQELGDLMLEFMKDRGGVGLAAPQLGWPWRIFVVDTREFGPAVPKMLFNPVIQSYLTSTMSSREGCLSLPGVRGKVDRYTKVFVAYKDANGQPQQLEASGLLAAVCQHEIDHLDGVLFVDRMPPWIKSQSGFVEKEKVNGVAC